MKVKDFLKKYRMCSNSDVFLQKNGEFTQLSANQMKNLEPEVLMNATVNSFDVIDNVMTIHIR